MKGLVFDGSLTYRTDLPTPRPGPGEALVRVTVAGICRTDLEIVEGYMGFHGIPGHEFVGTLMTPTRSLDAGTRVSAEINAACGICPRCTAGRHRHCADRTVLGIAGRDGAFAEYLVMPETNLHPIPDSVETTFAGATAEMSEAFGSLYFAMAFAIVVVYIVMVLALGSLITPFIILFSLPLAAIGAFPALAISGHALGISAMVGMLMLIGIVVTNAIVLLDFVEQRRAKGDGVYDALIGGARVRVRPILMTAIATMLALTPVAMGMAHGSVIAVELAVVVIGGLFSSTLLTLIVIPVLYSLVEGGKAGFGARFAGGSGGDAVRGPMVTAPSSEEAPAPTDG